MGISRDIKYYFRRIKKIKNLEKRYAQTKVGHMQLNKKPLKFDVSENPKVSIIIPFYNEGIYTLNCLTYLYKYLTGKISYEILLIDDNSPEHIDFSLVEGVSVIRNVENLGFLRNINKGIALAKAEYIYILNNDTEVRANFLEELFYVFDNFENVGAVGSKLINADGSLQEAGSLFMKDCDIRQVVRKKKPFYPEVNYIYKVDYCSGCSLLFKKFTDDGSMNLFDEQFVPAYFEETDFCFNLKYNQGKDIYYTPFSEVLHYNGVTYNSTKNTDESKLQKKEALFKTNLEKFKAKWSQQLNAIQATKINDRIQEIYGKSVLLFSDTVPEYDKDSGSNRLKEIIKAFLDLGFHVTFVAKYTYIENPYIESYQRLGVNVFYEHQRYTGYKRYLKEQKSNASVAWFYGPRIFKIYYAAVKKYLPKAKLVYDMVDIHHLRYKRAIELDPKRISLRKRFQTYKKMEIQSAKIADVVVTISDFEESYMKSICDAEKIITISNIHYLKINKNNTCPFEKRNNILFIGSRHTPNIDAIYHLYNNIMPLVWVKIPNLKVHIIGDVDKEIKDIQNPNLIFHGYVPNIESFFISNKLMVAPLRYGAGVKGKIGQAFEYFLPVVTSSVGAEGMKLRNYKNAIIEDDAVKFAEAIIAVYTNKALWEKLQGNSEQSLKPFSIATLKKQIKKLLLKITN